MNANTKQVLKFFSLPGIWPRLQSLFINGFANVAFFMAYALRAVNLLPRNHPYLWASNFGRFGIRHVLSEAYRNIDFKRENTDKIIIYFVFLLGFLIVMFQMCLLVMTAIMPYASAGIGDVFFEHFGQVNESTYDLAFIFLERVFGYTELVNGNPLFNSCVAQGIPCRLQEVGGALVPYGGVVDDVPSAFHNGLHRLIYFYNLGILGIAMIIFLYLIATVVGETAITGTPFGRRFNRFWAPVRMIVALALLFPYTGLGGINAAQLITLYVAKHGSNFATNTWLVFLEGLTDAPNTPLGDVQNLVGSPNVAAFNGFNEFMYVAVVCGYAEQYINQRDDIGIYVVRDGEGDDPAANRMEFNIGIGSYTDAAVFNAGAATYFGDGGPYEDMRDFATELGGSSIEFVIGEIDEEEYADYPGAVKPICGAFSLQVQDMFTDGAVYLQKAFVMWIDFLYTQGDINTMADAIVQRTIPTADKDPLAGPIMSVPFVLAINTESANFLGFYADNSAILQSNMATWHVSYAPYGWGGAGLWYNKIAELNGGLIASANSIPSVKTYPDVMEYVLNERISNDDHIDLRTRYSPVLSDGQMVNFESGEDAYIANTLFYAQSIFNNGYEKSTGGMFTDAIKAMFGLDGLYDMVENHEVNPLAQLVGVGRSLIESTVTNFGVAAGAGIFGVASHAVGGNLVGTTLQTGAQFTMAVALTGLSIGFILFYIVPFMPFMYFFFAMGEWVRSIFEAMVGLPLWGLAHIRIDGEGLPGPVGMNGYYLVFEIFLRPVLIVFGLIGGLIIFTAQVTILHEIWSLVVTNVSGAAAAPEDIEGGFELGTGSLTGAVQYVRAGVDQLFYTVMYAIIVYMMALSSFKFIDAIPNHILRWLGTSVSTFGEKNDDRVGNILNVSFLGSKRVVGQFSSMFGGSGNFLSRLFN